VKRIGGNFYARGDGTCCYYYGEVRVAAWLWWWRGARQHGTHMPATAGALGAALTRAHAHVSASGALRVAPAPRWPRTTG
jgi:hypothetical protein